MAGIVFLKTNKLKEIVDFYINEIGAKIWVDQGDCVILKHGNFIFGFCEREGDITKGWLLTFFYQTKEEVDQMYTKLKHRADSKPKKSEKYKIYQFYAKDPENRPLEFQVFLNDIDFDWKSC